MSKNILARSHGRVEAVVLVVKTVLVLVSVVEETVSPSVRAAFYFTASGIVLYAYFMYMPFYAPFVNSMHVAFAATFVWSSLCLVLAIVRDRNKVRRAANRVLGLTASPQLIFSCRTPPSLPLPLSLPPVSHPFRLFCLSVSGHVTGRIVAVLFLALCAS